MNYELPILSPQHAAFCRAEAERRYEAKLIRDRYGMLVAEDAAGVTHTDAVLRALSYYREGKLSLYEIFLTRVQQPYMRETMDKSQRKLRHAGRRDKCARSANGAFHPRAVHRNLCGLVRRAEEGEGGGQAMSDEAEQAAYIYEPNIQSPEHAAVPGGSGVPLQSQADPGRRDAADRGPASGQCRERGAVHLEDGSSICSIGWER
jgi:hypothetical protein